MNYCSTCGNPIALAIPENDSRQRHVCQVCDRVYYQNPNIITGCLATLDGKVLLCRRAIAPQIGYWTLPAGFLENGETTEQGAMRETWEEARASVKLDQLYGVFNVPHINQVYMVYKGQLLNTTIAAGVESMEVQLFDEADIPWDQLAFSVVESTLKQYFIDRKVQRYPLICETAGQRLPNSKPLTSIPFPSASERQQAAPHTQTTVPQRTAIG